MRFVGKFLLVVAGVVAGLLLFRISFAFSRWAGYTLVAVLTVALYATAPRWVRWLPGLLVLGIINSLVVLITHHAPNNPRVTVSREVAIVSLGYYAVGCAVTTQYDPSHLSAFDRFALLLYFACMVWPACLPHSQLADLTPTIAWPLGTGTAAIIVSFATRRMRLGKSG